MGIGASVLLIAVGAILTFALNVKVGFLDLDVVGWILMAAGAVGLFLTVVIWGPRRRAVVTQAPPPSELRSGTRGSRSGNTGADDQRCAKVAGGNDFRCRMRLTPGYRLIELAGSEPVQDEVGERHQGDAGDQVFQLARHGTTARPGTSFARRA